MSEVDQQLRDKIRMLGHVLGTTIESNLGSDMLQRIEMIRQQAMLAQTGKSEERLKLINLLNDLPDHSLLPVVRGFNQSLNLSNLAEQQHKLSWRSSSNSQD